MNIGDYKGLESTLHLEQAQVGILIWKPSTAYIRPFNAWSVNKPPLSWYEAYNLVKHNRNREFARANLENVRHAIAGLFALLASLDIITRSAVGDYERPYQYNGGLKEYFFASHIFTLMKPR